MSPKLTKTDRLIHAFGRDLVQGVFTPGAALPSEAELCERYDTSRNVMREVIKVLATKRLIDAQRYRGLVAMPREQWNYLDADVLEWALSGDADPALIASLIEVRSLIEPAISRWAAERATAVDLVAIEAALNGMKANTTNRDAFMEADIAFHRAIVAATHNFVVQQLADAISALQRAIFDHTYLSEPGHMALTIKEHSDLFDMIRMKNPVAAEDMAQGMISRTASRAHIKLESAA
ncbi:MULTISPECIES: FadR/GntR family transcriptional regulator [unclassified Uliginosibacterium]|uniref:FadR/GntR family transcriptional regulator n=1 Tax=unclassified Uliginosibacterium TaxID=2621521 RepID=UPI0020B1411B|nr:MULTISPECIES: FadR/GntR family transcriptional regulator [unclassified Uliginosibacterium]MDO6385780.1 FadR/GntR family transcriptional regulator [Uliginosibacterium sp. 31-12]